MIGRRLPYYVKRGIGGIDANTVLMLHGEDFSDESLSARAVANIGGVTLDTGKFSNAFLFDGTISKYLTVAGTDEFNVNDFTIDFWVYRTGDCPWGSVFCNSGNAQWNQHNGGVTLGFYSSTNKLFMGIGHLGADDNGDYLIATNGLGLNEWTHVAFVRSSSTVKLYINGILNNSMSQSQQLIRSGDILVGRHDGRTGLSGTLLRANVDELRISNIVRWTSDFTPPTELYSE